MSDQERDPQVGPSHELPTHYSSERAEPSSSHGGPYGSYADGAGHHAGSFSSHLDGLKLTAWDGQPSYPGASARQGPLLPPPNPPPLVHPFDHQQPPSHQSFLYDMMHRTPTSYLPQPNTFSPQYGAPPVLPPPPPPLFTDGRRDQDPARPTYDRAYPSGQTDPRGSASPPSSASSRSGRASVSFAAAPSGTNGFGAGHGPQHQEAYYSPTHLQGGFPTSASSSSYFANSFGPPPSTSNHNNNNNHHYTYPPYSQAHALPPPTNMLNNSLPYPFHYSSHGQPSPQSSIATPALWSSTFPRDGMASSRPFSAPTPPPHHQQLVYDHDHQGSSSSGLPSRARRSDSSPSGWNAMGGDPTASSSSSHHHHNPNHQRQQPYGRPSPRARSASAAERGGARASGGGRKKLPVEATDTLLNFYLQPQGKYPSREQKLEWERTTGLTLQQVEDWFINKRRRIKTSTLAAEEQARKRSS